MEDQKVETTSVGEAVKPPKVVMVQRREGIDHVYANNITVGITAYDVIMWFSKLSRLVQVDTNSEPVNQVEQRSTVTLAWAEAKVLRNTLTEVIDKYESLNGEINPTPKIPPKL